MPSRETLPLHGQGLDIVKGLLTEFVKRLINSNDFKIELKAFWIPSIGTKGDDVVRITPYVVKEGQKWEVYIGEGYTLERPEFVKGEEIVEDKRMRELFQETKKKVDNNEYPQTLYKFEKKIFGYEENVENNHYLYFIHLKYKNTYLGTTIFKANKKILIKQNKVIYENIVLNFWQVILTELIIPIGNVRQGILYLLPPFYDKFELVSEFPNNATEYADTDLLLIAYCKNKNGSEYQYITKFQWKGLNYQLTFKHSKAPPESDEDRKLLLSALSIFSSLLEREQLLFRIAIISILVDSFAHNIAAHALMYLTQHFKTKASKQLKPEYQWKKINSNKYQIGFSNFPLLNKEKSFNEIEEFWKEQYNQNFNVNTSKFNFNDVVDFCDELRGWLNKLGIIPEDEKTYHFLKYMRRKAFFWMGSLFSYNIGSHTNFWEIINEFAQNSLFLGTIAKSENIKRVKINVLIGCLLFESGYFDDIKKHNCKSYCRTFEDKLKSMTVYLPGSFIGVHSFFTILENIIRNVKHLDKNEIENGEVTLCLHIEDEGQKYKVTVWLEGNIKDIESNYQKAIEAKERGILDKDGRPILGGMSQMLVCAQYLYAGNFEDYQNKWDKLEITKEEDNKIKYSFYIWKSKKIIYFTNIEDFKQQIASIGGPIGRYKIFVLNEIENDNKIFIFNNKIWRVVEKDGDENSSDKYGYYYEKWIEKWLNLRGIKIKIGNDLLYRRYKKFSTYQLEIQYIFTHPTSADRVKYKVEYNKNKCKYFFPYRSQKLLHTYLLKINPTSKLVGEIKSERHGEVLETLLTKIVIFDKRFFKRYNNLPENYKKALEGYLFIKIFPEYDEVFDNFLKNSKYQFSEYPCEDKIPNIIIIHYAFVEELSRKKNKKPKYIIQEICNKYSTSIIVLTSGRGRTEWEEVVEKVERAIFVPVESLIDAWDNGLMGEEEMLFDIKYNLVKAILE